MNGQTPSLGVLSLRPWWLCTVLVILVLFTWTANSTGRQNARPDFGQADGVRQRTATVLSSPPAPDRFSCSFLETFERGALVHASDVPVVCELSLSTSTQTQSSTREDVRPTELHHLPGSCWTHGQSEETTGRFALLSLRDLFAPSSDYADEEGRRREADERVAAASAGIGQAGEELPDRVDHQSNRVDHQSDRVDHHQALVLLDVGERSAISRVLPCSFSLDLLASLQHDRHHPVRQPNAVSDSDSLAAKTAVSVAAKESDSVPAEQSEPSRRCAHPSIRSPASPSPVLLLAIQFELRQLEPLRCGGAYVKLLERSQLGDGRDFNQHTPYTLMFGPDRCGGEDRVHLILQRVDPRDPTGENRIELHLRNAPAMPSAPAGESGAFAQLYTLLLVEGGHYSMLADGHMLSCGHILEDFHVMEQLSTSKPEDWDDEPWIVASAHSSDDSMGDMLSMDDISVQPNPNYMGPWPGARASHSEALPELTADLLEFANMDVVGFELLSWQAIAFDNLLVTRNRTLVHEATQAWQRGFDEELRLRLEILEGEEDIELLDLSTLSSAEILDLLVTDLHKMWTSEPELLVVPIVFLFMLCCLVWLFVRLLRKGLQ